MTAADLELLPFSQLAARAQPDVPWLWQGYLARGDVTLLTSMWKTGKTTLLALLLARLHRGGTLAGLDVRPARAAVLSEETAVHWGLRGRGLDFGPHARFLCRPFRRKPTADDWRQLIDRLDRAGRDDGLDLLVIDSLAAFTPAGSENNPDSVLAVLRPLEQLTSACVSVLLLHHPRKGRLQPGQSARGSGALSAYADILVEMQFLPRTGRHDRRRRLSAWSRHEQTPRELIIELSADGTDYTACGEEFDDKLEAGLARLVDLLSLVDRQLVRRDIVQLWPAPKPAQVTIWRWLDTAVQRGLVARHGTGSRGAPFRYTLPGRDLPWEPGINDLLGTSDTPPWP